MLPYGSYLVSSIYQVEGNQQSASLHDASLKSAQCH